MNTTSASTPCFEKNPCSCAIHSGVCRGLMPAKEMAIFGRSESRGYFKPAPRTEVKRAVKTIANKFLSNASFFARRVSFRPRSSAFETLSPKRSYMPNSRMALPPRIFSLSASDMPFSSLIIFTVPMFQVAEGSPCG